jgi:hypothetical protein
MSQWKDTPDGDGVYLMVYPRMNCNGLMNFLIHKSGTRFKFDGCHWLEEGRLCVPAESKWLGPLEMPPEFADYLPGQAPEIPEDDGGSK